MLTNLEKDLLIKIFNNETVDTNKYGIHIINLEKNRLVKIIEADNNPFYAIMLTYEGESLVNSNFPEEYLKNYNSTLENNVVNVSGNSNNINSTINNSFNNNDFSEFMKKLNTVENSEEKDLLLNISKSNEDELKHLLKNFKNAPEDIKKNKLSSFIYDVGVSIAPTMFSSLLELVKNIVM